ncbi:hypothetical protein B0H17DRAFT_1206668 [Mycena rosella]|uniref:Uncharacterized protein n=1 Tax=Mycena rosella TaxID=1033263 RepID=A0AAD7D4V8_MYCRO|nr:hypothetical protein B0H17DRAFT_1206668 [Mycena rosella]
MNHPYSGAASYIYANEYPRTPADARREGPYGAMQSFIPIESVDSLPTLHPFSSRGTWDTENSVTQTQMQSFEDYHEPRPQRESQRRLLPLNVPVTHPYAQRPGLNSWIDDKSVTETEAPTTPRFPHIPPTRSRRAVATRTEPAGRGAAFVPYEQRPFEERERDRARLAAAWRRNIKVR